MYSVDKGRKVHTFYGSYETRMWNDEVDIHYFDKKRGGRYFLSKCADKAASNNLIFNSSLVNSDQVDPWIKSRWSISRELCLYTYLFNKPRSNNSTSKKFEMNKLHRDIFEEIVLLDREVFEPYWRSSALSLFDTLKSCRDTSLYTFKQGKELLAYAIVGFTMRTSFLQRFAVHPNIQGLGLGSSMLENILEDMYKKKMISMKLNTQPDNVVAQKLYKNKGFSLSNQKLFVMESR
jgi:ribosomal protein S18 acetylase RimI-like enzyme